MGFRWRVALGFVITVVLAVGLTGLLVGAGTANRFALLVSESGQARAQMIAPILGAEYAYWGSWETVAVQRIDGELSQDMPASFFIGGEQLGLDNLEADSTLLYKAGAEWNNLMPNPPSSQYLRSLPAEQDAESLDTSNNFIQGFLPAKQIIEQGVAAIDNAIRSGEIDPGQTKVYLQALQTWAMLNDWQMLASPEAADTTITQQAPQLTVEASNWMVGSLVFGDMRVLVADDANTVVIDSADELNGIQLDPTALANGAPIYLPNTQEQIGTVLVGAELGLYDAQQRAFLDGVQATVGLSVAIGGVAALLLGLVIARQVTRPVTDLTRAAERIAAGDLEQQVPVRSHDELGQMSEAFNRMASEIHTQRMLRHRLINDIAHELNTPLSLMQLEIQAMLDGMQSSDETAGQLHRELAELHNLVGDLAYLAETDRSPVLEAAQEDINNLVEDIALRFRGQAEANNITLAIITGDAPLMVTLDAQRIGRALSNLLHNALRHTPPGGQVRVEVAAEQDQVAVTVTDSGAGIPAEDLPFIWERFYRADRSRSRDTGGRGLGLAIVQQSIAMHGGEVWAESQGVGAGSVFGFSLPLSAGGRSQ